VDGKERQKSGQESANTGGKVKKEDKMDSLGGKRLDQKKQNGKRLGGEKKG